MQLNTADKLKVGGAAGMLIFGLVGGWASFAGETAGNAFDWVRGWISWILVIAVGVITILRARGIGKLSASQVTLISVLASGVATLLMLLLIITGPDKSAMGFKVEFGRGWALWVSFIATAATLAGSVMGFTASGGNLKDLTDVNKLKNTLGGGSTPPPPPAS